MVLRLYERDNWPGTYIRTLDVAFIHLREMV